MADVAVVTGAASGIGRGIAHRLAKEYLLVLVDINETTLPQVEKEITEAGHTAYSVLGDVSKRATHEAARRMAESKGNLISWVNCAGWTRGAPLHNFPNDPAVLEELIGANQVGTFWGCVEAVASYTTRKVPGAIVNISSVHGRRAWPDHAVYEMTKAAVDALTRNVAVSYGPFGIRANAVAPGAIMTPAMKQSFIDAPDPVARRQSLELFTPLKRIGEPSEIAEVVAFLLSTRASYVSGQSIAVEGGWTSALGTPEIDTDLAERYGLDPKTGLPKS
ncbi:MAG: SDR family oxidoreductase [Candidatus Nanopelagicaceae bacterium]|jgi:NAD(P)-dependent dehydrogenase (short-subunit alcohol dehydrogenase family)